RRGQAVAAKVPGSPAVLSEFAGNVAAPSAHNHGEHAGSKNRAKALSDPVANHFAGLHTPRSPDPQADCGIDVASGYGTDPVGGPDQRESEGNCDPENADFLAGNHSCAATEEHEDERANQFCKVLLHELLQGEGRRDRHGSCAGSEWAEPYRAGGRRRNCRMPGIWRAASVAEEKLARQ